MQIELHSYSSVTGEELSSTKVGIDPTIGDYPILSFTTTHAKPETGPNEVALYLDPEGKPPVVINGGSWVVKSDFRGVSYWDSEHKEIQITEIGVTPPHDAILEDPGPLIGAVKRNQIFNVSKACEQAITQGFKSSAIGDALHYPAKLTDQTNLMASVVDSMRPGLPEDWATPFWCCDGAGVWTYRMHTAAQIQQVGADGKADILVKLQRKGELEAQINACSTVDQVAAITWSAAQ